jgi:prephenate dehydratase
MNMILEPGNGAYPIRVAYQGEPGAYSEKATKELLGSKVTTVAYQSFEDAFKAVASMEADYAVVPIENSLGGSIHTNFDLLLRYDLHIIAEHEFRVEHTLLALPGVKRKQIKKVMSHPQALAQCDNYLRDWGVGKEATYDTAGSAKMIKEKAMKDCAAIASDLAGETYGMEVLDRNIEDHDNNYTRFLLLSRHSVSSIIPPSTAAKTSVVFLLPNNPGALYKALACFSLRDIDFSKIESRPTSAQLLEFLEYQQSKSADSTTATGRGSSISKDGDFEAFKKNSASTESSQQNLPRFQYTFYLDFLASELDDTTQNALYHLREQSQFVRVLGSYPKGSELIGPVKNALAALDGVAVPPPVYNTEKIVKRESQDKLKIGIIGFGNFGQFLAKKFVQSADVYAASKEDKSAVAKSIGCEFFPLYDMRSLAKADCDVILLAVSIVSFEEVLRMLPKDMLRNKLIVDVLSVKVRAFVCI